MPVIAKQPDTYMISKPIKKNTKTWRVLHALTKRSYNRFEAARHLHDTCLNSTVSTIGNRYGVRVDRIEEVISGYQNNPTQCCRYWISEDQHKSAFSALGIESQT